MGGTVQVVRALWHKILRAGVAGAILCSSVGCSPSDRHLTGRASPGVIDSIRSADLRAHGPVETDHQLVSSDQSSQPLLFPGSAIEPGPPHKAPQEDFEMVASADPVAFKGGGVELNFDGADIQTAAKTLLGDTLGMNFVVDPRVQGNVTLASTGPIRRKDLLPVFESALRMSNVAIVREGNIVKVSRLPRQTVSEP